jgi:peroxiredoxin
MLSISSLSANEPHTATAVNQFNFTTIEEKKINIKEIKDGLEFSTLKDKNVIILFYIYSGEPCRNQLKLFSKIKTNHSDLEFVTFELKGLSPEKLKNFQKELSLKDLHMINTEQALPFANYIAQRMGWQGPVPLLIVLNKSGVIKHAQLGAMNEEEINNLENIDIKQLEISIKKYVKLLCSISSISASLITLAIITLPHSSITRYPINDLSPVKIYNKKLPIVKKLPDLIDAQDIALKELKIFNSNLEEIKIEV